MINDHAFVSAYFQIIQLNTFDDGSWWANEDTRIDDFLLAFRATSYKLQYKQHVTCCMIHFSDEFHQLKSVIDQQKYSVLSQINDTYAAPKIRPKVKNIVCLNYRHGIRFFRP